MKVPYTRADVYVLLFAVLLVYRPIKYLSRPFNKGFLLINACLHIAYIYIYMCVE